MFWLCGCCDFITFWAVLHKFLTEIIHFQQSTQPNIQLSGEMRPLLSVAIHTLASVHFVNRFYGHSMSAKADKAIQNVLRAMQFYYII